MKQELGIIQNNEGTRKVLGDTGLRYLDEKLELYSLRSSDGKWVSLSALLFTSFRLFAPRIEVEAYWKPIESRNGELYES